jgi:hypothetical protein
LILAYLFVYLMVITDPYHGLVYEEINVYEVRYGLPPKEEDDDESDDDRDSDKYAFELSGDYRPEDFGD